MTLWIHPVAPIVAITAGGFYKTRNGRPAFIERLVPVPWAYNGEPREHPTWSGLLVDDGTWRTWEFWGTMSPQHFRHFPGVGFAWIEDELDIVGLL